MPRSQTRLKSCCERQKQRPIKGVFVFVINKCCMQHAHICTRQSSEACQFVRTELGTFRMLEMAAPLKYLQEV